ncbi:MAG: hypothetical protein A2151_00890 [Candidatus Muproteobacteria bacterium RBG_16_65_34]|uniref:AttH domain-containing protein n=1 Tax=Candidatus Muproteobacteria bacterium RBG_16_65_34 TaxID=1817760 RepID=A0A1F6TP22_9PROT|nr:MAG: hypothetical protein A2151_00890 [Candidatus Muproteobacteria bacterium RBG_16_65_34]
MIRRLLLACLGLPVLALAAGPPPPHGDNRNYDFALQLTDSKAVFHYDATPIDTAVQWIGVTWRERFGAQMELGLLGGHSWVTQTQNPATAGFGLDGHHAGISLHLTLLDAENATLFFAADHVYQNVDHRGATQSVTLEWSETRVRLGAVLAPGERLRLYGGADYGRIEGKERVTGDTPRTTEFDHPPAGGGFAGLDLNVDRDGYIGVETWSGLSRGGKIYFKRRF